MHLEAAGGNESASLSALHAGGRSWTGVRSLWASRLALPRPAAVASNRLPGQRGLVVLRPCCPKPATIRHKYNFLIGMIGNCRSRR